MIVPSHLRLQRAAAIGRVEAPFRVIRANAAAEEVEARTEVVLEIGDAAMAPCESARTYANAGPEPVEFLQGTLIASGG